MMIPIMVLWFWTLCRHITSIVIYIKVVILLHDHQIPILEQVNFIFFNLVVCWEYEKIWNLWYCILIFSQQAKFHFRFILNKYYYLTIILVFTSRIFYITITKKHITFTVFLWFCFFKLPFSSHFSASTYTFISCIRFSVSHTKKSNLSKSGGLAGLSMEVLFLHKIISLKRLDTFFFKKYLVQSI